MAGDVTIKTNSKQIERAFRKFGPKYGRAARKIFNQEGQSYRGQMMRERLSGSGDDKDKLNVRTGTFRRSIVIQVVGHTIGDLAMFIIFEVPYAMIHEYGGEITPKRAQYLAIPLDAAKTAAGVGRWSSPLRDNPDVPEMYVRRVPDGLMLFRSVDGEPMFKLARRVKIPPRLKARETLEKRVPDIIAALEKEAVKMWKKL